MKIDIKYGWKTGKINVSPNQTKVIIKPSLQTPHVLANYKQWLYLINSNGGSGYVSSTEFSVKEPRSEISLNGDSNLETDLYVTHSINHQKPTWWQFFFKSTLVEVVLECNLSPEKHRNTECRMVYTQDEVHNTKVSILSPNFLTLKVNYNILRDSLGNKVPKTILHSAHLQLSKKVRNTARIVPYINSH